MRRPNILDIVRAVTHVAPSHPQVTTWWYAPAVPFRLAGEAADAAGEIDPVQIAVEAEDPESVDLDGIAGALSEKLWSLPVRVREHGGPSEETRLVRVLTVQPQ